jgi:hypothetical protein
MNVQAYYIRLCELNTMVEWLPGVEEKQIESQLDQAFYDAMPDMWMARYTNAGRSLQMDSHSEMMHFFCTQQANAHRADFRHKSKMKAERKKSKDLDSSKPRKCKKWRSDAKHCLSRQEKKEHNRSNKQKSEATAGSRVYDDDACPVHPGSSHTWGECYINSQCTQQIKVQENQQGRQEACCKQVQRQA